MLQVLQESLGELDKQLTTYLTDRIDAFQVPQEAQVWPWSGGLLSHKKSICNGFLTHQENQPLLPFQIESVRKADLTYGTIGVLEFFWSLCETLANDHHFKIIVMKLGKCLFYK